MNKKNLGNEVGLQGLGFLYEDMVRSSAFIHILKQKNFLNIYDILRLKIGARDIGYLTDDLLIETKDKIFLCQIKKSIKNSPKEFFEYIKNAYNDHQIINEQSKFFFYLITSEITKEASDFKRLYFDKIKSLESYEDYKKIIFPKKTKKMLENILKNLQTIKDNIEEEEVFYFLKKCNIYCLEINEGGYIDKDYYLIESLTNFRNDDEFNIYYQNLIGIIQKQKEYSNYISKEEVIKLSESIKLVNSSSNIDLTDIFDDLKENLSTYENIDKNIIENIIKKIDKEYRKVNKKNIADCYLIYLINEIKDYIKKINIDLSFIESKKILDQKFNFTHIENYKDSDLKKDLIDIKKDTIEKSNNRKNYKKNILIIDKNNTLSTSINFYEENFYKITLKTMAEILIKIYENKDLFSELDNYCSCKNSSCSYFKRLIRIKNLIENLKTQEALIILIFCVEPYKEVAEILNYYILIKEKIKSEISSDTVIELFNEEIDFDIFILNISLMHILFFYVEEYSPINNMNLLSHCYFNEMKSEKKAKEVFVFEKNIDNEKERIEITQYDFLHEILRIFYYRVISEKNEEYEICLKNNSAYIKYFYIQLKKEIGKKIQN